MSLTLTFHRIISVFQLAGNRKKLNINTVLFHFCIFCRLVPFDVRKAGNGETELKYAEVSVAFTVLDILDVSEQNSEFEIYFMIQLWWNDFKLEFEFLKDVEDKNLLDTKIWTPNLQFFHIKSATDYGQKIFVKKKSKPRLEENVYTKEIYKGSENPIIYVFKKRILFTCFFDSVSSYPKYVNCIFIFTYIEGSDNQLTNLKMTKFRNFGPDTIGQYIIEGWTHSDDRKNQTKERVLTLAMVLNRKLTSIFMVTYLPTSQP